MASETVDLDELMRLREALDWWRSLTPDERATASYYADLETFRRQAEAGQALRAALIAFRPRVGATKDAMVIRNLLAAYDRTAAGKGRGE